MLVAEFLVALRRVLGVTHGSHALFLYTSGHTIAFLTTTIRAIDEQYYDIDGFLYLTYATENAFG